MDATNPSANPTFASATPLHIGAVGLAVRDPERVAAFYSDVIGLVVLERADPFIRLGAGGVTLVWLERRPDAIPDDPRTAGLYHTAFLMPTRSDLGAWVRHATQQRVSITGVANHGVSEAIYLDDPEGNGVEVYADRPPETWRWTGDEVAMTTDPLDVDDLMGAAGAAYAGAPAGLRIGHVHLRVGDLAIAETFYRGGIGLDLTRRRTGAAFMSSGRYHHHVAANVWQSRGAGRRDESRAGLSWLAIEANDSATLDALRARLRASDIAVTPSAGGFEAQDPWGTRVRFATA